MQPPFIRLFGRGNVELITSDRTTPVLTLSAVTKPDELRESIRRHVDAERRRKGVREMDMA